jgi:hypothetical protein
MTSRQPIGKWEAHHAASLCLPFKYIIPIFYFPYNIIFHIFPQLLLTPPPCRINQSGNIGRWQLQENMFMNTVDIREKIQKRGKNLGKRNAKYRLKGLPGENNQGSKVVLIDKYSFKDFPLDLYYFSAPPSPRVFRSIKPISAI